MALWNRQTLPPRNWVVVQWSTHALNLLRYVNLSKFLGFRTIYTEEEAGPRLTPKYQKLTDGLFRPIDPFKFTDIEPISLFLWRKSSMASVIRRVTNPLPFMSGMKHLRRVETWWIKPRVWSSLRIEASCTENSWSSGFFNRWKPLDFEAKNKAEPEDQENGSGEFLWSLRMEKYCFVQIFSGPFGDVLKTTNGQDYYGFGSRSARWCINLLVGQGPQNSWPTCRRSSCAVGIVFGTLNPTIPLLEAVNFLISRNLGNILTIRDVQFMSQKIT